MGGEAGQPPAVGEDGGPGARQAPGPQSPTSQGTSSAGAGASGEADYATGSGTVYGQLALPATAEAAQTEIERMRSQVAADFANHPYSNSGHRQHKEALDYMTALYAVAAGEAPPRAGQSRPAARPARSPAVDYRAGSGTVWGQLALPATAAEAKAEIERVREAQAAGGDKHPLWNPNDPQHAAANDYMNRLYALACNEQAEAEEARTAEFAPETYSERVAAAVPFDPAATAEEVQQDRALVADWLSAAQVPQGEAHHLVQRYNDLMGDPDLHEPHQIAAQLEATKQALELAWGDDFETKAAAARRAVKKLDRDGNLSRFLCATGLGDDALTIRVFADAAERNGW